MSDVSKPVRLEGENNPDLPYQNIFEALSGLVLLLSPQLKIQGATEAYLRETLTEREDIIGKQIFDVFPDNPDAPESSASVKLRTSLKQVLSTGKPHKLDVLQYDIPDPENEGKFIERYWSTTNTPLLNQQGEIFCILHETVNVSEEVKAKMQLTKSQVREQDALAQATLQRQRLERLFDQAPAALAILEGPELEFKVLNKAYQQLFPGRKLLGLPVFEALPELREQVIYDIMYNVYNTGETFEGKEVLVPMARGEGMPVEDIYWNFIYQALYDAQGKVTGVLIFALDVTEFVKVRRRTAKDAAELQALNRQLEERVANRTQELQAAQAEAERQSKRLEALFMQAPAAICILDGPKLVFELVNPSYAQLLPGRELLGKPILEALPEIKDKKVHKTFRTVYETGVTHEEPEILIPIMRHDGVLENRYFRYIQQARHNEQGEVDGIIVFALEITEQVAARKAVEASEQQLRLVTDSLPVLISYIDKNERYRFANKAYDTWFKLKGKDILNKHITAVLGERAYNSAKEYIQRALAGEQLEYETAMPYTTGLKYTRTSFVPDQRDGEVVGFYALVTDVTEQVEARKVLETREQEAKAMADKLAAANKSFKLANAELGVANQRLMHINTDLDNFIYTASHDLKAPISNIEMLMEELLLELPQESMGQGEVEHIMGMMKGAVARFKKTIASLTEITKLQKDELGLSESVDVGEVVKEVQLDMEQAILKSGAQINTAVLDCTTVMFTEKNLRSIVYNLLSNALKYKHPERKPEININCHKEGDYHVLQVQDNGLGLNEEQQGKLFSMFRRFHDHVEGSGVGLYMVKRIVDNTGGKIEVESQAGKGSTFRIYFREQYAHSKDN